MAYELKTLPELIADAKADVASRLPATSDKLLLDRLNVLATIHAAARHSMQTYAAWTAEQLFPDTAEGDYLIRAGAWRGYELKQATYARGYVELSGSDGAVIAAGTQLQSLSGALYKTLSDASVAAGVASVEIEAEEAGSAGNLAAGSAMSLMAPIAGLYDAVVVDTDGISGGAEEETIEELRARIVAQTGVLDTDNLTGKVGDYVIWAKAAHASVQRAWEFANIDNLGTLGVAVVGADNAELSAAVVADVQAYIDVRKQRTAPVRVYALEVLPLDLAINIVPDTAAIRAEAEAVLAEYVLATAAPSDMLYLSALSSVLSNVDGEISHSIQAPAVDPAYNRQQIGKLGAITWV